ncbi:endonuclease domain-containing protein, partial [Klebsiella pneumoniae]|nr:endonuclease domain-containing protein [Klebsiella pneumoniae]
MLLVECDGHNFHERTPEQAKRDRSRDRDLAFQGYRLLRFTGREIYHDADGCAREILRHFGDVL